MVEEVRAWRDQNGDLHTSLQSARQADARIELLSLFNNHGIVSDIINNVGRVFDAISPLVLNIEVDKSQHTEEDKAE